tara:strand:- start:5991 stop:6740 length:750 start_codon:yes stop_codon:yes gene_type:complete
MINPVTDPLDTSSLTLMSEPLEEAATNVSDDINQAFHHESSIAGSESDDDDDDGVEGSSTEKEFKFKPWMEQYKHYSANKLQLEYNKKYKNAGTHWLWGNRDKDRAQDVLDLIAHKRAESNESYRRRHAQSVIAGNNPFANPSYRDLSGLSKGPAELKPGEQYKHFGQGAPGIGGGAASSGSGEYHADTGFRDSEYYTGRESVGGGFDFGAQKAASNMYGDYMGNSNFGRQVGSGQSVLDNLYANMSRI